MNLSVKLPNVTDLYQLSPMQQLMLFHALSDPSSRLLSNQFCYELRGDVDTEAFRRAWQLLIERHASLRTAFFWEDLPHPVQVVHRAAELSFERVDLSNLHETARQQSLKELRARDRNRAFELSRAPLMRITLVKTSEESHSLFWNSHHLVIDRWCLDVIFADLVELYRGELTGSSTTLPPAGEFRDYIAWIQAQDAASAESYWRAALRGLQQPSLVSEPSRTLGERQQATGERLLSVELSTELREMARSEGLTLAALLQGGIALWLAELTGQTDVIFGATVSGRPVDLTEAESTVGSFINNLPTRVRLPPSEALVPWLHGLQLSQARRNRYEYVSANQVHEWSGLTRAPALFDLHTLINPGATGSIAWPGFELVPDSSDFASAYPVTLAVDEGAGALRLRLAYDVGRFSSARAQAGLDRLADLLAVIHAGADRRLGELVALSQRPSSVSAAPQRTEPPQSTERASSDSPEKLLSTIWSEVLGVDRVGLDEDLFALGTTSLQIARAFYQIEERLGLTLPLSTLFAARSIRELLRALDQPLEGNSPLVAIQPRGTRPQLFVIPGIGGNVVGLSSLTEVLGEDQPFYGLESKGLDGQEAPMESIEEIADDYIAAMNETAREPFVVVGICWGASVAFEMAQRLREAGRPPALLALMDPTHVEGPKRRSVIDPRAKFVGGRLALYWREFREASWADRGRLIRAKAKRAGEILRKRAPASEARMAINQFRVAETNLAAVLRYRPRVYHGSASLFFTAERGEDEGAREREAWRQLIEPRPVVHYTPGRDTGDALMPKNVGAFAELLRREIDARTRQMRQ